VKRDLGREIGLIVQANSQQLIGKWEVQPQMNEEWTKRKDAGLELQVAMANISPKNEVEKALERSPVLGQATEKIEAVKAELEIKTAIRSMMKSEVEEGPKADDKGGAKTNDENRPLTKGRIDVTAEIGKHGQGLAYLLSM